MEKLKQEIRELIELLNADQLYTIRRILQCLVQSHRNNQSTEK